MNRALIQTDLQNFDLALKDHTRSIELDPSAKAYFNRGQCNYKRKEYLLAEQDLRRALLKDPQFLEAFRLRALCHEKLRNYGQMIEELTSAINLDENEYLAYQKRADAYVHLQQLELAVSDLSKLISMRNENSEYHRKRGVLNAA